jgi:hypothetical protein
MPAVLGVVPSGVAGPVTHASIATVVFLVHVRRVLKDFSRRSDSSGQIRRATLCSEDFKAKSRCVSDGLAVAERVKAVVARCDSIYDVKNGSYG